MLPFGIIAVILIVLCTVEDDMHYKIEAEDHGFWHGDKPDQKLLELVDTYNFDDIVGTLPSTDAIYETKYELARIALDIFEENLEYGLEMEDGLSDGYFCDEGLAHMAEVENRIMNIAWRIRQRRLDALNKNIANKKVAPGE